MRKLLLLGMALVLTAVLAGCGGGGSTANTIVTQILSDPAFDGDISLASGTYTVTQGNTQSVFAGIDPSTGVGFRAILDFPLTGAGGVPGNAVIVTATMDIFINSILPQPLVGTIPIRIDLVSFQPPTLIGTDFDRTLQPALASTTIFPPISQADLSGHVPVDVTSLMTIAQQQGLPNFQVRILLDLGTVSPGLIEINDTTGSNRGLLAPLLQVEYF